MDAGTVIAVICASSALCPVAIVGLVVRHRERMAALKNRQEGAPGLVEDVNALRREMAALRETSTRFDMSFDAALHRVEQRLGDLEQPEEITELNWSPPPKAAEPVSQVMRR